MLSFILAKDVKNGIGKDNILPWGHCKEDMKHFSTVTKDAILILGYNTYQSLKSLNVPFGTRKTVVITKDKKTPIDSDYTVVYNKPSKLSKLLKDIEKISIKENNNNVIVIGGAKTYNIFAGHYDTGHVTVINSEYQCDTYIDFNSVSRGMKEVTRESLISNISEEMVSVNFIQYKKT